VPTVLNSVILKLLEPSGLFQVSNGFAFLFKTLLVDCNKYFNFGLFDKFKDIDTNSNPFPEHKLLGNGFDVHVMV